MCLSLDFFSSPRGSLPPTPLLSLTFLIYHQWTSCNPLMSSLLIVMYKVRGKTAISRVFSQFIDILLPGLTQTNSKKFSTRLNVSYVDTSLHPGLHPRFPTLIHVGGSQFHPILVKSKEKKTTSKGLDIPNHHFVRRRNPLSFWTYHGTFPVAAVILRPRPRAD